MDGEENDKQSDLYGQLQFHYTTTLFVAASHAWILLIELELNK
jgi:hypothetical protein